MPYVPFKKGTLLIPYNNINHLFVIVTGKCGNGQHLIVNFTTVRPNIAHDPACIVEAGDHPFIKAQSYALYRSADIQDADRLTKMVGLQYYKPQNDASDALLIKMRAGIRGSQYTPRRIINYFDDHGEAA